MAKPARPALLAVTALAVVALGVALLSQRTPSTTPDAPAAPTASVVPPTLTLRTVADARPAEPVRLIGALKDGDPEHTIVTLQRRSAGRWIDVAQDRRLDEGIFMVLRRFDRASSGATFRAVARHQGETVAVSEAREVTVRPATGMGPELLPDIGPRKLTDCSESEQPCFWIETVDERRWLRFPVTAVNVGKGPLEMLGDRSSTTSADWTATRKTYHANGGVRFKHVKGPTYFYARDEHEHWHIKDFHTYQVIDADGTRVRRSEKEAFCFEDNTTYRDWAQRPAEYPQVPRRAVYTHAASCGEGDPQATTIVHGLSPGWGDTYPTTLPDQGVDITGLRNGVYTVRVEVDTFDFVKEADETNNTATVTVRIRGNRVTPDPGTATGL